MRRCSSPARCWIELPWLDNVARAKTPKRLPVVLYRAEVQSLRVRLNGALRLVANLRYDAGLRIMECLRLRVKDVDFARREIPVRGGKGFKDRGTMLPATAIVPLQAHLLRVQALHGQDLAAGQGAVYLPCALERKYPGAATKWGWQYVFPSARLSTDPRSPSSTSCKKSSI